jgi:hypothetical protein
LGRTVHTVEKNSEALVVASMESGVEINAEKTKYMVIWSCLEIRRQDKMII